MPIETPTQLVDEFKKSGEFDRLRRELLIQFRESETTDAFISRVEDIARQRLNTDPKLEYMPPEAVHRELMQEMDRYPVVERAVADVRMLSDPAFASGIRASAQKLLKADKKQESQHRGEYIKSEHSSVVESLLHSIEEEDRNKSSVGADTQNAAKLATTLTTTASTDKNTVPFNNPDTVSPGNLAIHTEDMPQVNETNTTVDGAAVQTPTHR